MTGLEISSLPLKAYETFNSCLLPTPRISKIDKNSQVSEKEYGKIMTIYHLASCIILGAVSGVFTTAFQFLNLSYKVITYPVNLVTNHPKKVPEDATLNLPDEEEIKDIIADNLPNSAIEYDEGYEDLGTGFSTSCFQDSLLGTHLSKSKKANGQPFEGKCNWEKWIDEKKVKFSSEDEKKIIDYLNNPDGLIDQLYEIGANSFRLSLERSIIEPEEGTYDREAIDLYRNLCHRLKENGIKPIVTFHHFVEPAWFMESGRFEKAENIDNFVRFCSDMVDEFQDEVDTFMTFNEPAVYAFQTYFRKVYPIKGHEGIKDAGKVLKNMLIAHTKAYRAIKAKHGKNVQVGLTHQWLKFVPHNKSNPLETLICSYLSHITEECVRKFFIPNEDGKFRFEFKLPLFGNEELIVEDDGSKGLTDFIGVQHYGFPVFMFGHNWGEKYPGEVTTINVPFIKAGITIGASCQNADGATSSFGPPFAPETLIDALLEAKEIDRPIVITETGFDAHVKKSGEVEAKEDQALQERAYKTILAIVALCRADDKEEQEKLKKYLFNLIGQKDNLELWQKIDKLPSSNIDIRGLYFWTLFKNLEWESGFDRIALNVSEPVLSHETGRIVATNYSKAATLCHDIFNRMYLEEDKEEAI